MLGAALRCSEFCSCQRLLELRKVHFQYIGFDDVELRVRTQPRGQVAVEFDHREAPQPLDQRLRQRRQAGADFDHGLARARVDGAHDGVDDGRVGQEVLAKALARDVLHGAPSMSTFTPDFIAARA